MATNSRVGYPAGVADTLRCLELDLARHKSRIARSPADFLRGDSLSHRDYRARSCLDRPDTLAPATA